MPLQAALSRLFSVSAHAIQGLLAHRVAQACYLKTAQLLAPRSVPPKLLEEASVAAREVLFVVELALCHLEVAYVHH